MLLRRRRNRCRTLLKKLMAEAKQKGAKRVSTMLLQASKELKFDSVLLTADERELHAQLRDIEEFTPALTIIDDLFVSGHGDEYVTSSGSLQRKPTPDTKTASTANLLADFDDPG